MTTPDEASALQVVPDEHGTRVEVRSGVGFVVADSVVVQSVAAGPAGFTASLRCISWPVQLKLYRGTLPARASSSMATTLCQTHAERNSDGTHDVSVASSAELSAWGADAAAFTIYALRTPEDGLDYEECHYLLKGTVGWRITRRFNAGSVTPVAWNEFTTRLDATLGWEGARAAGAPIDSVFVDGQMRLKPDAITFAEELARWLVASGVALDEVVGVTDALRAVVYSRDPPDARVEPESLEILQSPVARARTPAWREVLHATLRGQVATWRDLRGLQLFLEHLARVQGMLAPTPVRCDCGAILPPHEPSRSAERSIDLAAYRSLRRELDALAPVAQPWMHPARRPGRHLFLQCTLDPLQGTIAEHLAACPIERDEVAPFGARKAGCGARRDFAPPPEVERIQRGGYCEFVGLSVNEGLATWCAFDLDHGVAVKVQRFSGRYLAHAPTVSAPTATRYARETQNASGETREIVTVRALAGRPLAQIVALANVLWETEQPPPPHAFDVYNRIELRDGLDAKASGGTCRLDGPAGRIERTLNSLLE